jgi:2-polyprenyl-6-methoxyphenol hydroxylase-like FAD-dependent oxidoreductase
MTAVVVGAGAAGATAALALQKICASEVVLYERAAQDPATHPGWVTLGPTAMTALDTIGVAEAVAAAGFAVEEVVFITGDERSVLPRREPGHKYSSTHVWRRDLLVVLREHLDGAIRFEPAPPIGDLVAAPDVDLIVGADGAHSLVRHYLGDLRLLDHVGESIVYGHSDADPVESLSHSVLYFWNQPDGVCGCVSDPRDGTFWFCRYVDTATPTAPASRWRELAANAPFVGLVDDSELFGPFALWELPPTGPWTGDKTVLIGDAAHPLSPAAGRGATSAIEDGVILAQCLAAAPDTKDGLTRFVHLRRPRALHSFGRT